MKKNNSTRIDGTNQSAECDAEFLKFFGHSPEMCDFADYSTIQSYKKNNPAKFYIFGIPREYPVTNFFKVPKTVLDGKTGTLGRVELTGNPGEFLTFQLMIWTNELMLKNIRLDAELPFADFTCFNLGGVDCYGKNFTKTVNVESSSICPLWCGFTIPETADGNFSGKLFLTSDSLADKVAIPFTLNVSGEKIANRGEDDDHRLARLAWLNSTVGQDKTVFAPFIPLKRQGSKLFWLGHALELDANGLPLQAYSTYTDGNTRTDGSEIPLFTAPVTFTADDEAFTGNSLKFTEESDLCIRWEVSGRVGNIPARLAGSLEFDGFLSFQLFLKPEKTIAINNSMLKISHAEKEYFMGLNLHGGKTPEQIEWVWNRNRWQDGYWCGSTDGGMGIRLRDSRSHMPMGNCHYNFNKLHLPDAWYINGSGGISIAGGTAVIYSGARQITADQELEYGFEMQFTPFRPIDAKRHWNERIWQFYMHGHTAGDPDPIDNVDFDKLRQDGVNIINIHHALLLNPIQNYPFSQLSFEKLQNFVARAHKEGFKVGLYYTCRQLAVMCPEFWPFWSLNGEIFFPGSGRESLPATNYRSGVHPWIIRHVCGNYLTGWAEVIRNGPAEGIVDLALQLSVNTRFENFYCEGLRCMLEKCPFDVLYLDDIFISRNGFQRIYRIFEKYAHNTMPIIDFHAWNQFALQSQTFYGNTSVPLRDMANMPYYTRLWLGECYEYNAADYDYYLIEISGRATGHMGQMLQRANPARGMLFGMTDRYGWFGDPRKFWNFADTCGIPDARLILEEEFPGKLRTSHPDVHCSVYYGGKATVIAVASWSKQEEKVLLHIPQELLPAGDFRFHAPEIAGFQAEAFFEKDEAIPVSPEHGILLVIE